MKRAIALVLALSMTGLASFADGTAPSPSAPMDQVNAGRAKAIAATSATASVQSVTGTITKIIAGNPAKKLAETLVILVGKTKIEVAVNSKTVVTNAKGKVLAIAKLKKGETVTVTYTVVGKLDFAKTISIVS